MNSFARAELRHLSQPTKQALVEFVEQRVDCLMEIVDKSTAAEAERFHELLLAELNEVIGSKPAVDSHIGAVAE